MKPGAGLGAHRGVVDDEHQSAVKGFENHSMSAVIRQEGLCLTPGANQPTGERIRQSLGILAVFLPAGPEHQKPSGFGAVKERPVSDEGAGRIVGFGLPGLNPGSI